MCSLYKLQAHEKEKRKIPQAHLQDTSATHTLARHHRRLMGRGACQRAGSPPASCLGRERAPWGCTSGSLGRAASWSLESFIKSGLERKLSLPRPPAAGLSPRVAVSSPPPAQIRYLDTQVILTPGPWKE